MAVEIKVPTLGESVTEATVAKWFKQAGEAVAADEPLVELETDKVTVEVPAPSAGTSAFRTVLLPVFREEWVYDFGPNLFMRVLTLDNGRVVQVDNGARGSRQ